MRLKDKIALITGASRGIGRAVAVGFAREGAKLFLVGHADKRALEETVSECRSFNGHVEGELFDIGSHEDVCRLADAVEKQCGTLSTLPLFSISPRPSGSERYARTCTALFIARSRWSNAS